MPETEVKTAEVVQDDRGKEAAAAEPSSAGLVRRESAALDINPDEFEGKLQKIKAFQKLVQEHLHEGHDYGTVKGVDKPFLLKPGAEKIVKLLNLSDRLEIMDKVEDWDKPFFHYVVKCTLRSIETGDIISEGMGSCNSKESKYRWAWVFENEIPKKYQSKKKKLRYSKRKSRGGKVYYKFRIPNQDVYSLVNTILKMAKKRAMVDAALSVGRLSDLFTQDPEAVGGDSDMFKEKKADKPAAGEEKKKSAKKGSAKKGAKKSASPKSDSAKESGHVQSPVVYIYVKDKKKKVARDDALKRIQKMKRLIGATTYKAILDQHKMESAKEAEGDKFTDLYKNLLASYMYKKREERKQAVQHKKDADKAKEEAAKEAAVQDTPVVAKIKKFFQKEYGKEWEREYKGFKDYLFERQADHPWNGAIVLNKWKNISFNAGDQAKLRAFIKKDKDGRSEFRFQISQYEAEKELREQAPPF